MLASKPIRKLCTLLDSRSIYITLAKILDEKADIDFISTMVQTLNLILLTAPELASLRNTLKNCFQQNKPTRDNDIQVFLSLIKCWNHNPVATFSLCLLAQAYDLSAALIQKFSEIEITVGFLMQIDKLVQLLESPIFIQMRLQLLEVSSKYHGDLLKSLYGLLMLLPQSQAFKTLSDRLATVSSLKMNLSFSAIHNEQKSIQNTQDVALSHPIGLISTIVDCNSLLLDFESVQNRHSHFRSTLVQQKSLLYAPASVIDDSISK
jgi:vacuole morphology and inheritance protein 14